MVQDVCFTFLSALRSLSPDFLQTSKAGGLREGTGLQQRKRPPSHTHMHSSTPCPSERPLPLSIFLSLWRAATAPPGEPLAPQSHVLGLFLLLFLGKVIAGPAHTQSKGHCLCGFCSYVRYFPNVHKRLGAYCALCGRCAKSWLFSTTGSSVSSKD